MATDEMKICPECKLKVVFSEEKKEWEEVFTIDHTRWCWDQHIVLEGDGCKCSLCEKVPLSERDE